MEQTIEQAAIALGKSVRQVRYLIKTGKLRARKIGTTWVVESGDLPRSPEQLEVAAQKIERLREVVDVALDPTHSSLRRYSVRDLRATQLVLPLLQSCARELGGEHPATRSLQRVLEHLSRGCHRFRRAEKADAYREARDEASRTVCALLLAETPAAVAIVDGIEQELMAALAGLLRRCEMREHA